MQQTKSKYIKPQIFSISSINRTNPTHCRSLVDLNNLQTYSAQKQNHHNIHHYSSIHSNQDTKNIQVRSNCNNQNRSMNYNTGNGNGNKNSKNNKDRQNSIKNSNNNNNNNTNSRQALTTTNMNNVSNIAKILLGASNKNLIPKQTCKKSNTNLRNVVRKNQILAQIIENKNKYQGRNNSQTNLRQFNNFNNSLANNNNNFMHHNVSSLEKQKSEKSLKKSTHNNHHNTHNSHHNNNNNNNNSSTYNNNNNHNSQHNTNSNDYNLLIKLKQYIQQLKQTQQKHIKTIQELTYNNTTLHQQLTLYKDKIQVYQIRQKQLIKKLKHQQSQIHKLTQQINILNDNKKKQLKNKNKTNQCQQHLLIIQSLRNVIDQQMAKIIQMQTYKVQLQQHKNKKYYNKNKQDQWNQEEDLDNDHGKDINKVNNQVDRKKFNQVYSFKKRSKLNQSSIMIQDQIAEHNQNQITKVQATQNNKNYGKKKNNGSQSSIPEPYNQLIKCLKSDSRIKQKIPTSSNSNSNNVKQQKNNHMQTIRNNDDEQQSYRASIQSIQQQSDQQYNQYNDYKLNYQQYEDYQKHRKQCSEDQILQEVGEYLQNIRRNVRDC